MIPSTFGIVAGLRGPAHWIDCHQNFALGEAAKAGVETGGFRKCVACSKPKASLINSGSAHARPRSSIPTGTPTGAFVVDVEKPAGTSMAGKPARAATIPLRSF